MLTRRFVASTFWVAMTVLSAGVVSGQNPSTEAGTGYPNKPIRIVATEAGGSGDLALRILLAQGLPGLLGQPMIVDNRSGANVVGEIVARATPDGYTLLSIGNSFWLGPLLQKTPYDPVKDFSPITLSNTAPHMLAVHPLMPVNSVKELIVLAKAKPGELNYATTAVGGAINLSAELFKSMAGVKLVGIPYKGGAAAINDLMSGQVQLMFPPAAVAGPYVKSGRLKALAVTSAQPSALAPGLPTMAAAGLPGFEVENLTGFFAPAKTPAVVINRLHQESARLLNRPDVKEKFLNFGVEAVGSTPEQFAAIIKSDIARMGKVIKDAGIKVE